MPEILDTLSITTLFQSWKGLFKQCLDSQHNLKHSFHFKKIKKKIPACKATLGKIDWKTYHKHIS